MRRGAADRDSGDKLSISVFPSGPVSILGGVP